MEEAKMNRRTFMKQAGASLLTATVVQGTARSYTRILGANDRIVLGQLGCGQRSSGHVHMVHLASKQLPVEVAAVCDLWSVAREERAAQVKRAFQLEPKQYQYSEQMLANKDIDAVLIATGDFQHAQLCTEVVRAGKDCYVEKPFANDLDEAKAARDTVKQSRQIVQMGTQHRSEAYPLAVRDIIRSGRIGKMVHIEQEWNVNQERWRFVPNDIGISREMLMDTNMDWKRWMNERKSKLREEDTDWRRWLLGKPYRPFDPHVYLEFRLYKEFSSGIFDQWLSHGCDLVHLWTDESYPESVVASGGIFVWRDGRENPDTCTAVATYPKGFLYTYKTTFGNSYRSFSRIQGRDGTIENYGGEGASLFVVSKEGGRQEIEPNDTGPVYSTVPLVSPAREQAQVVHVPHAAAPDSVGPDDDSVVHMMNWIEAMRDRKQPNATVDHGFSHSVVCIMASQAYWSGKKQYWHAATETIQDHPPET
jgi:predicted dehydrogenase